MNPLLSIVIPCKNEVNYIGKTLESLYGQTGLPPSTSIIIADAGSKDGTMDVVSKHIGSLNIKVTDGGLPAMGRNKGASRTDSEYILFMDADVSPGEPDTISGALTLALENDLDLVSTHIHTINGNWADKCLWMLYHLSSHTKIFGAFATGMFMLIKSNTFWRIGGFNEKLGLGEDWELTQQISPQKFSISNRFINATNRRFVSQGYIKTFYQYLLVALSSRYRYKDLGYFDVDFE